MKAFIKIALTICLLLMPTMAFAQVQELNLKVTTPEAELIWKALRKLPVEEVETLMQKIRQQVAEQQNPKPVEPQKEPEKK